MSRIIVSAALLISASALLPLPVTAEGIDGAGRTQPLPPPPGPYISSRQRLDGEPRSRHDVRLPFVGQVPASPGYYMPSPGQLPPPPPWWRGTMGR